MKFNKTILSNGLRLITVPMKDNPTVTVMVLVEAGSKYESKDISGISHFLEHMYFKGTKKRPKSLDIAYELDSIGADYNAFTGQEFTGYFAKSDYRHSEKILDVVSDIYLNQTLPEAEIEKEKGVIVEEIRMYQDLPQRHVQDLFTELLYGDQPAGWNIAGTVETVRAVNREKLADYRNRNYVSGATVVVVAGNFDEKHLTSQIEACFGDMNSGEKHRKTKVEERQNTPAVFCRGKTTDQSHFVLGVRSFDIYDERNTTLAVLSSVLGGGMSSRLFQKLREEMGVGYYVRAGSDSFTDHGNFAVSAGVEHKRLVESVEAVLEEFRKIRDKKIDDKELRKAKDSLTGSMYLSLESSDHIADYYGFKEVLRKDLVSPKERAEKISGITAEDIQAVAKDIFKDDRLNFACIGPSEDGGEEVRKVLRL
ncbi:MAG: pitrilysin family protein [bacterium]|nr:pitrilysin family protein [bacterium]